MFQHTVATSQSAHVHAIHWGQREPLPEWDISEEPTTMELVNPNSQHQEIKTLYYDVYLLCRLPSWSRCKEYMAEQLHKEILDSIKKHLRLQQPPKQQARQQTQWPANNPRPDPPMAFATANQKVYEEMMAIARDAQQWALAEAAILEVRMERMGCSTDCQCSTNHQCSASCRRSRFPGQVLTLEMRGESLRHGARECQHNAKTGRLPVAPTVMAGGSVADQSNITGHSGLGMTMEGDPNHPSWGGGHGPWVLTTTQAPSPASPGAGRAHSGRHWCGRQPPSSPTTDTIITTTTATPWGSRVLPLHVIKWIEWCANYVQTPSWWEELMQVPGHTDHQEFA